MSPVAVEVWPASDFTSLATTAKPRPASPARGGFDGGVQRQQIRLLGDIVDQSHDVADALRLLGQAGNGVGRRLGRGDVYGPEI